MFGPRAQGDYWFRIGRVDFTSTLALVFLGVVGMVVCAVAPAVFAGSYFTAQGVLSGQVWRLFTWPFANGVSIWTLLTFLMLWFFGTALEFELGRDKMLRLYLEIWAALTVAALLVGLLLPGSTALAGLDQIEFLVLLLWIAEYPTRRFFFNIPAWVLGVFFVSLSVLQMLGTANWGGIIAMFLGFLLVGMAARRLGMLTAYPWLPGGRRPRPTRTAPRSSPSAATRTHRRHVSDEQRLDELLAKISAEGLHSLTKRERAELEALRQRRMRR